MTSLKANMIAGYAAQIYTALAGIVMLPFYLRFMGDEAYGLVAIFVMLQGWLLLLDMGLSPTMAREMAQFRAGVISLHDVRRLLHILEAVFASIATVAAVAMMLAARWLATHWLRLDHLPIAIVETSLMLMAPALALRLSSGLYRGAVSGLERIVWLSGFNAAIATARYALVIPWFLFFGTSPIGFFAFQLAVAVVEVVTLRLHCHRMLHGSPAASPSMPSSMPPSTRASESAAPRPLKTVLAFSLSIGAGASLWSVISQVDKLILSRLLSLADFGYFSLAVVAASGVGLAAGPITFALSPRFAHLHAAGQGSELIALYRRATQLVAIVASATATMLICFAGVVLFAWTGRADLAQRAAVTLALYAAGNAIGAVATMAFFLQFAVGDLRLHVRGMALLLLVLLPALLWATRHYGMAGAGVVWLAANLLYLVVWTGVIHRRFAPRLHLRWLLGDVARIAAPTLVFGIATRILMHLPNSRLPLIVWLAGIGTATLVVAVVSAPVTRILVADWLRGRSAPHLV